MRSRRSTLVVAAALISSPLYAGFNAPAQADDAPPPPVRIMLAGDSLTQGRDGDFTYRYRLYKEFVRQGIPVDLVGPRQDPNGGLNHYADPFGWDLDHNSQSGAKLHNSLDAGAAITASNPDVLVVTFGTNDLLFGGTVEQVIADWRTYIANARAAKPSLKLVLGEVASRRVVSRDALNAALGGLATELTTAESPIAVADLDSPSWAASRHTWDGTHPTPTGETEIAQKVALALQSQHVLGTPAIARNRVLWTPDVTPVAKVAAYRRIVLSWSASMRASSASKIQIRLTSGRTGKPRTSGWIARDRASIRILRPGSYRVQVRVGRGTMVSEWTRTRTIRLKKSGPIVRITAVR